MVTTMANELVARSERFALLGICAAGGLGSAAILERTDESPKKRRRSRKRD
jgi:acetyl-CoA acyltransferase